MSYSATATARRIYKFPIFYEPTTFLAPAGARFISFVVQHSMPTLWAIIDRSNEDALYEARIVGTGHELPEWCDAATYVASTLDGPFVWHVFVRLASARP